MLGSETVPAFFEWIGNGIESHLRDSSMIL
jgi:hypothetical protein